MSVAAMILAAGQGVRFGQDSKLLAALDGKPLVRHVAEAALASMARPVIAVLGHRRVEVAQALNGLDVIAVDNPAFHDGLSTSLKAGFAALPSAAEAAVVLLGDMPRVNASLIDRLIAAWRAEGGPSAVVPAFGERRGNPVLLSRVLAPAIANLTGDRGAGSFLRSRADVVELVLTDPSILQDVDTPESLEALRRSWPRHRSPFQT
jgi:molybdenum cofactor cytidylyltransferase